MAIGLGIDTGGTYTDSVIIDMDTGRIIGRSKAQTTRYDLIVGIKESLEGLPSVDGISLVCLSSTLATNSVVEGKTCRVGLVCIGKEGRITVTPSCYAYLDAEIDLRGNIITELDESAVREALSSMKGKVDVLAVAGYLSVRYPVHENRVRELSDQILGVPVVCAHDLTSKLGYALRTNTAVINAGLIPVTIELIDSVKKALSDLDIRAPLMIVRGDGSIMNVETAVKRPIETIMSGPASSMTCAMRMSGISDSLVIDIGGTTTDIGMIKSGFIHTIDNGAVIGGHLTRVRAADLSTYGIGGDSHIMIDDYMPVLSSVRVIPLCVSALRNPGLKDYVINGEFDFYIRASNELTDGLTDTQKRIISVLDGSPKSVKRIERESGTEFDSSELAHLQSTGHVTGIGLTPTDILSANGELDIFDSSVSSAAVDGYCIKLGIDRKAFLNDIRSKVVAKICDSVTDHLTRERISDNVKDTFYEGTLEGQKLHLPIIGVGAPAKAWLPDVAKHFDTELVIIGNYDIGNAIGAISSSVTEYTEVYVRAFPNDMSDDPHCRVFSGEDCICFENRTSAMDFAVSRGKEIAYERARSSGACDIDLTYNIDETYIDLKEKGIHKFRGADLIFRASGRPVF